MLCNNFEIYVLPLYSFLKIKSEKVLAAKVAIHINCITLNFVKPNQWQRQCDIMNI